MKPALKSLVCDVYLFLFFTLAFPVWFPLVLFRRSWREGFAQRLGFVHLPPSRKPRIWIHSVSVGEVLAARSLIEALADDPRFDVVLSTTTKTGREVASKRFPGLSLFHYPLDLSPFVRRTLNRVAPDLIVMIELEVWPNFLLQSRIRGIPVAFVNGRITRRSAENYPVIGWLLGPLFEATELFCVQNEEYASRLLHLGARGETLRITGNMKYDNLPEGPDEISGSDWRRELGIGREERVIVGGSIHPGEDTALVEAFKEIRKARPGARLVLVPRHPEKFDRAEEVVREAGLPVHRRTAGPPPEETGPVLVVDTMGELSRIYSAADVVFVGGSLIPHGGQNMLEPAAFGKPVLFGSHVHNFLDDAALLLERGAAWEVKDTSDLREKLLDLVSDAAKARDMGERGTKAVAERRGATERTLEALERVHLAGLAGGAEITSENR